MEWPDDVDAPDTSAANPASRSGVRTSAAWLIMPVTYLIIAAVLSIVAYLIVWSHQETGNKARHAAQDIARALEIDISRNVELYGSALQRLTNVLERPAVASLSPDLRNTLLFGLAGAELGPIRIIDPQGNIVADSETGRQRAENVADQDYFSAQQEGKGVDLFISRPFKDRLGYGADSIALSRRIADQDGAFAGVASAVLRLNHFRTLFQHIDVGPHGVITFASTNGDILVRQPGLTPGGDLGLSLTHIPMFQRMLAEKTGFFTAAYPVDGIDRMRAFRQIGGLPLMIVVALAVDDVYAEWWRRATWAIVLSALVCVGIVILAWRFQRELRRRELAERDLAALAKDLSGIAVTDPLTGLGNRRQFDSLLQREWRRAIRAKSSLSLLMIDIDHFKEFNDRFGHPQGDQVLRILAKAISSGIRRPADSGARYGGEEFAVILPDTDLSGAATVAENIRAAFKNDETADPLGGTLPTISIGASSCRPSGEGQSALLRSADQALYAAKERGRNRVEAAAMGASDH